MSDKRVSAQSNLVSNEDITVVIQGPLYLGGEKKGGNVVSCIESVNIHLPGAHIIVSTWEDQRTFDFKISPLVDEIIYTEDPSPIMSFGVENNITRQIVSTMNGLRKVNTEYCLKIRANMRIKAKTSYFCDPGCKINLPALSGDPVKTFMLFAMADFCQFSKTTTLRKLWDFKIDEFDKLLQGPQSVFNLYSFPHRFKFAPEQYLGRSWVLSRYGINPLMAHQFDISYVDFVLWKRVMRDSINFFSHNEIAMDFGLAKYTSGYLIFNVDRWLSNSDRLQYAQLIFRKYIFFPFNSKWWVQFLKKVIASTLPKIFWRCYHRSKKDR